MSWLKDAELDDSKCPDEHECWKPPKWIHESKPSETSFLSERKIYHGQNISNKRTKNLNHIQKKNTNQNKNNTIGDKKKKIDCRNIAEDEQYNDIFLQLQEFENSKLLLIYSTSTEINRLRHEIQLLSCNQTSPALNKSAEKSSYFLGSFWKYIPFYSFGSGSNDNTPEFVTYEYIVQKFKNVDYEHIEQYLVNVKLSKYQLLEQTSAEIGRLTKMIHYLQMYKQKC